MCHEAGSEWRRGCRQCPAPIDLRFAACVGCDVSSGALAPFVQAAATASDPDWTLALNNSSETNANYLVAFSDAPTISITYDHAPDAPGSFNVSPWYWASDGNLYTSSATPTFSAAATDPDGDEVQVQFDISSGSTVVASGTSPFTTSGTPASWTDTTTLADGTYSASYRAYDGTEWGPWSYYGSFTVETDTPAAPAVTCAGYPSGTWSAQASGGTTCSWSAPLPHMNGYSWELDGNWGWTTGTSVTIDPGPGMHTLEVSRTPAPTSGAPRRPTRSGSARPGLPCRPRTGRRPRRRSRCRRRPRPGTRRRRSTTGRARPGPSRRSRSRP